MHQTRSMAPFTSLSVRAHQSGPPRRAATPARRASGRRAPAKTGFSDHRTTTLPSVVAAASTSSSAAEEDRPAKSKPVSIRLPIGPGDQADQAAASCVAAWRENREKKEGNQSSSRLLVTLSLPLIGSTDLDDWPGGIRQQFKAAKPMVERMLSEIRRQADGGDFFREAPRSTLWDDGEFFS